MSSSIERRPAGWRVAVARWFDCSAGDVAARAEDDFRIDWPRIVPFVALHVGALGVFLTGASLVAVGTAFVLFYARLFSITAFYHRYFSHRAFKTSRVAQFLFAVLGNSAAQRGPLWWASHHRRHHEHADGPLDLHSPKRRGFWWSHVGWFTTPAAHRTDLSRVRDLAKYPELVFLDRYSGLVPLVLFVALYAFGAAAESALPALATNGPQMLAWGVASTVLLFHVTYTINSLAHGYGSRPYATADDSRNNVWLALLTLGEGWHNNHHRYPAAARNGFLAREIDPTWYGLRLLAAIGVVRDLRPVPRAILDERARGEDEARR
jgi:stearoyl-CoA desaturase (Delta-9 desaturase)